MTWIEEFHCGCSHEVKAKKDLVGYCGTHGSDQIAIYKLQAGRPVEWQRGSLYLGGQRVRRNIRTGKPIRKRN